MLPRRLDRFVALDGTLWLGLLLVALAFAAAMALGSPFNAHPDEVSHARAADYYRLHWLPPRFGEPDALPSYSKYGYSYLHERDVVYLLAGKWSLLVAPLAGSVETAYRLFNVFLLALLAAVFARNRSARPLLLPLLFSAQVWYVFSYFNADAIALATAFFAGYQVSVPGSAFNRALEAGTGSPRLAGVLLFGLAIGLLLLSKRNYYVFLAFIAAFAMLREVGARAAIAVAVLALVGLGWQFRVPGGTPPWVHGIAAIAAVAVLLADALARMRDPQLRRRLLLHAAAAAVGLALFIPRAAFDKLVVEDPANPFSNAEAVAEIYAEPAYKPSQRGSDGGVSWMHLRERGVPYGALLFGDTFDSIPGLSNRTGPAEGREQFRTRFIETSFKTAFGVYGYMKSYASNRYYTAVAFAGVALLAALLSWAARLPSPTTRNVLLLACTFAALTVLMASLHAWTSDYQPQGRYLFPIGAMAGVAMAGAPRGRPIAVVAAMLALFALAAYSFTSNGFSLLSWS